jgi:hypothetical protein
MFQRGNKQFLMIIVIAHCLAVSAFSQSYYFNKNFDFGNTEIIDLSIIKDSIMFVFLQNITKRNVESQCIIYRKNLSGVTLDSMIVKVDSTIISFKNAYINNDGTIMGTGFLLPSINDQQCFFSVKIDYDNKSYNLIHWCESTSKVIQHGIMSFDSSSAGVGYSNPQGYSQFYLNKINRNHEILWEKYYGSPGLQNAWSVAQHQDSGYVIAGWVRQGNSFDYDLMLVRTDKYGNQKWLKKYGGPNHDGDGNNVNVLKNGNILMATCRHAPASTHYDSWLAIINPSNGNIIREQYYEFEWNNCFFTKPIELEDGNIILGGYRSVVNSDSSAVVRYASITKINTNGSVIWDRLVYYNPNNNNYLYGLSNDINGSLWGSGWTRTTTQDGWLIKLDSLGCPFPDCDSISVSIGEITAETGVRLRSYPNPASQHAIIYYLFSKQVASPMLEIFDLHGKLITRLPLNGEAPQGDVWMDLSGWVSGMYVMRIVSQGQVLATGKMLKGS